MRVSKSWSVLFLGIALFNPSAHAGRGVDSSGGGNAIVCFDSPTIATRLRQEKREGSGFIADSDIPHITSVELLDVHKAKIPYIKMGEMVPITPRVIEARPGETPLQYSERLKKRFAVIYPAINSVLKYGQSFFKSFKAYSHGLQSIDDVDSVENFNTATCVKATIIGQFAEPSGKFIAYDSRIFSLPTSVFPASDQALSYWHEYIYALAKYYQKAQSSDSTQTLLGAMITEGMTLKELDELVNSTFSDQYQWNDYILKFVEEVNDDLTALNLQDDLRVDNEIYSLKDSVGIFESTTSAAARIEAKAKADPRFEANPKAALERYNQKWRPVLYATPQIPREILSALDQAILQSFQNSKPWFRTYFQDTIYYHNAIVGCEVHFNYGLRAATRPEKVPALYNVVLPNGDEL